MLTLGNIVKREHFRRSQCSKMRLSESRVKLAWTMPSVSILDEVNVQCSMVNALIPPKKYPVVDDRWQFLFIVRHHDERLVLPLAERLDDVFHQTAVPEVQTVQRLVQYQ